MAASPVWSATSWSVWAASSRFAAVICPLSPPIGMLNRKSPCECAKISTLPPAVVNTPSLAWAMNAETSLLTSLNASDRPIDTATPALLPNAAASDAAAATALMADESSATIETLCALMPSLAESAPSPSMLAWITVQILFSVYTPAPLTPTPLPGPPLIAMAPAKTSESTDCSPLASIESAPVA